MFKQFMVGSLMCVGVFGLATSASAQTIVEVAQGDPDTFSSLVDAVVAQDLAETLSSAGPFTVFAPTNDAFANLPAYVAAVLGNNPDLLTDILLYHVVPGELSAADVLAVSSLETAQGESLHVFATPTPRINSANIIATNVAADNGVVHVIDKVLLPSKVYEAALFEASTQLRDALRLYVAVLTDQAADAR